VTIAGVLQARVNENKIVKHECTIK